MRVKVYRNLRRKCYSVMYKGKVIRHESYTLLTNVKFNVRAAGRDRVRREKRKNVHAFVEGEYGTIDLNEYDFSDLVWVSYNPYKNDSFVVAGVVPVFSAKFAILRPNGCWISSDDARIAHWNAICEMGAEPVA
jgi:hypothetical protein